MRVFSASVQFGCIAEWSHRWELRERQRQLTPEEKAREKQRELENIAEAHRRIAENVEKDHLIKQKS